jgi:hypothetical protein
MPLPPNICVASSAVSRPVRVMNLCSYVNRARRCVKVQRKKRAVSVNRCFQLICLIVLRTTSKYILAELEGIRLKGHNPHIIHLVRD